MGDYLFYCSSCNSIWTDGYENEELFCSNCGAKTTPLLIDTDEWDALSEDEKRKTLGRVKMPLPQQKKKAVSHTKQVVVSSNTYQGNYFQSSNEGTHSGMSIAAFICSLVGVPVVGLILGIIDLSYKDGRKRGLSKAAVIISSILLGIGVLALLLSLLAIPLSMRYLIY